MDKSKNFLASKTFQGLIIMVLTSLFGNSLGEGEVAEVAQGIVMILGALWAAWGRVSAKKGIALGKGGIGLTALALVVLLPACAGKTAVEQVAELPGPDQARFYAGQLGQTWLDLDDAYRLAWEDASLDEKAWLAKNLKPAIELARPVVDSLISAAKAWTIVAEDCPAGDQSAEAESAKLSAQMALCEEKQTDYEALYQEALNVLAQAQAIYLKFKQEI